MCRQSTDQKIAISAVIVVSLTALACGLLPFQSEKPVTAEETTVASECKQTITAKGRLKEDVALALGIPPDFEFQEGYADKTTMMIRSDTPEKLLYWFPWGFCEESIGMRIKYSDDFAAVSTKASGISFNHSESGDGIWLARVQAGRILASEVRYVVTQFVPIGECPTKDTWRWIGSVTIGAQLAVLPNGSCVYTSKGSLYLKEPDKGDSVVTELTPFEVYDDAARFHVVCDGWTCVTREKEGTHGLWYDHDTGDVTYFEWAAPTTSTCTGSIREDTGEILRCGEYPPEGVNTKDIQLGANGSVNLIYADGKFHAWSPVEYAYDESRQGIQHVTFSQGEVVVEEPDYDFLVTPYWYMEVLACEGIRVWP